MSPGRHEVYATMHSIVLHVSSVESAFVCEVLSELFVDVGRADSPGVFTVDGVSKPRRVHYRQTQFHTALFDFHCLLFYSRRLIYSI